MRDDINDDPKNVFERNVARWFSDDANQEQQLENLTSKFVEVYQQKLKEAEVLVPVKRVERIKAGIAKLAATNAAKAKDQFAQQNGHEDSQAKLLIKLAQMLLGLDRNFILLLTGELRIVREALSDKKPNENPVRRSANAKKGPKQVKVTTGQMADVLQDHFSELLMADKKLKITKAVVSER